MFQRRRLKGRRGQTDSKDLASSPQNANAPYQLNTFLGKSRNKQNDNTRNDTNPLANFDACVEASDALAASSGRFDSSSLSASSLDKGSKGEFEFKDCSVMVSPDGMLLFEPKDAGKSTAKNDTFYDAAAYVGAEPNKSGNVEQFRVPGFTDGREDNYESAISVGNDMKIDGEMKANGFSARGWDSTLATMAIRRAEHTLVSTGDFVEELILSRKNSAASASQASEQLRDIIVIQGAATQPEFPPQLGGDAVDSQLSSPLKSKSYDVSWSPHRPMNQPPTIARSISGTTQQYKSLSPDQKSSAGPLLFPGSGIYQGLLAIEQYNSMVAELDAHRWRRASSSIGTSALDGEGVLPNIQMASNKVKERASAREAAIMAMQETMSESETSLHMKKEQNRQLWRKVYLLEDEAKRRLEEVTRQRSRLREQRRRQEQNERQATINEGKLQSTVTTQEIWELVNKVTSDMDGMSFAPTGLPEPNHTGPLDLTLSSSRSKEESQASHQIKQYSPNKQQVMEAQNEIDNARAEIEENLGLNALRMAAVASDEDVQDAAGALLNVLSVADTTKRSTRIAAEGNLLSAANAQLKCLQSIVKLERESIDERLQCLEKLEKKIHAIDIRQDLNSFIEHEKTHVRYGSSKLGEHDDGGVASALAVLNCHSEGVGVGSGVADMAEMSTFSGWSKDENDETFERDDIEEAVAALFKRGDILLEDGESISSGEQSFTKMDTAVDFLAKIVSEKSIRGRGYRASTCYAINNHRGSNTQLYCEEQYDGLCSVLEAILNGCDRETADVATAKMCMMLAQTFYLSLDEDESNKSESEKRTERLYPKMKLCKHRVWSDEDFWVQALFQCVTDSLTHSGITLRVKMKKSDVVKNKKMKWHDLSSDEREKAASQVHSVIFSQLGALAHSMVEFGCPVEQACAFVRRLSVRHQLPLAQRSLLLSHLLSTEEKSNSLSVKEKTNR